MEDRHTNVVVICVIILAFLAVGIIQATTRHFFGSCLGEEVRDYPSPSQNKFISIAEEECPGRYSKSTVSLRALDSLEGPVKLLVVPSQIDTDAYTTHEVHLVARWQSEETVIIYYPQGLQAYVVDQLVPIDSSGGMVPQDIEVEVLLEPYAL